MNEAIRAVADRLIGLREVMDVSVEEAAKVCGLTPEQYAEYETGEKDIPVSVLHSMATAYNIEITTLISGDEPHMKSYFLTKKGTGLSVDRRKDYKYQALAYGFQGRKADPFMVTVCPEDTQELHLNSHPGHEFNLMMEGSMKIVVDGKEMILEEGDSLYFDATRPHGMQALNGKCAKFLAIIM
ncbi:MAG: XRE family transcriptional regulator [Treponemataceae bacterium]|nr:XRE family transcriptional regulator [Treponemataceae bacterium]